MRRFLTAAIIVVIAASFVVGGIMLSEAPTPSKLPEDPNIPGYPDFTPPPYVQELDPSELGNIRVNRFQLLSINADEVCAKGGMPCWELDSRTSIEDGLERGNWVELAEVIGGRVVDVRRTHELDPD